MSSREALDAAHCEILGAGGYSRGRQAMDIDWLASKSRYVMLELTSRCNLRCLYCAVSQPEFHGRDLELARSDVVAQILRLGPTEVQISGHGESTLIRDWHVLARELIAGGIRVSLTSNLALPWTDDELGTLVDFERIVVSCDTADPALFRRLRRGGELVRLEHNLDALAARAKLSGKQPYVAINCTLNDRCVDGLPALLAWARDHGARAVSLTNLVEYPTVDPTFPVRHPAQADPRGALAAIAGAARRAHAMGLDFNVMDGLVERLEHACVTQA